MAEEFATSTDFTKRGGALPVALVIQHRVHDDQRSNTIEAIVHVAPDSPLVLPSTEGVGADLELLVALHDASGHLLARRANPGVRWL